MHELLPICVFVSYGIILQFQDKFYTITTCFSLIVRESNDIDVAAVYHQLVDVYHSSESENGNESDVVPSTSTGPSTSAAAAKARHSMPSTRR